MVVRIELDARDGSRQTGTLTQRERERTEGEEEEERERESGRGTGPIQVTKEPRLQLQSPP